MACIYRKLILIRDPKTGQRVKARAKKWWGRFRDENGVERRKPLAIDKTAAQAMLHQLVVKAERKAAGLTDPFEDTRKLPLLRHADEFIKCLESKESNKHHVKTTKYRIHTILEQCKFTRIDDISASRVQTFLMDLRATGRSIASSNHYLRAIKMFTRWLVKDRRSPEDRLAYLSQMNVNVDRRRIRRPLSAEEFAKLLTATHNGPTIQNISGPDRAVLYLVGAYTGYRRNEIGSITVQSFNFESAPPTLTVEAGYSKRRRRDVLPLRSDFAEQIKMWLDSKGPLRPDQLLFNVTDRSTANMIKKDLQRAGIPYVDDRGHYADFHALRMTFITNLSLAGVFPKTAQLLARHSNINLTMNTYTMLGVHDQATAVESLPPIPQMVEVGSHLSGQPARQPQRSLFDPPRRDVPGEDEHRRVQKP